MATVTYKNTNGDTKEFDLDIVSYDNHTDDVREWSDAAQVHTSDDIPQRYACDDGIDEEFFTFRDLIDNNNADPKVLEAGLSIGMDLDAILEAYYGKFDSDEAFTKQWYRMGMSSLPNGLYIDWERTARDMMIDSFCECDGYYFWRV